MKKVKTPKVSVPAGFPVALPASLQAALRERLYANPLESTIRELLRNARDANRETGSTSPIRVLVKRSDLHSTYTVSVEDDGPGITHEQAASSFFCYGASTRGGSGTGSMSPMSLTDSFLVTTTNGGVTRTYQAAIREGGAHVTCLSSTSASGSSGTCVTIQLSEVSAAKALATVAEALPEYGEPFDRSVPGVASHVDTPWWSLIWHKHAAMCGCSHEQSNELSNISFVEAVKRITSHLTRFWKQAVTVNGEPVEKESLLAENEAIAITANEMNGRYGYMLALIDEIPYWTKFDHDKIPKRTLTSRMVMKFSREELLVSASGEQLSEDPRNSAAISAAVSSSWDSYLAILNERTEAADTYKDAYMAALSLEIEYYFYGIFVSSWRGNRLPVGQINLGRFWLQPDGSIKNEWLPIGDMLTKGTYPKTVLNLVGGESMWGKVFAAINKKESARQQFMRECCELSGSEPSEGFLYFYHPHADIHSALGATVLDFDVEHICSIK